MYKLYLFSYAHIIVVTSMKTSCMLVLAVLLCSVVHVYCQEVPYITFNGDTLPNHSYLEFSQIGHSRSNSVRCHTDLTTCCSGAQGNDRGDWYFPNGNRLQFSDRIYESRNSRVVILGNERYYDPRNLMEGIYKCTIAVQADTETRETVYIGLYNSGGKQTNDYVIIIRLLWIVHVASTK